MDVNIGDFVFLKDKYFEDFPNKRLVKKKERLVCFVYDVKNNIYWVVPLSDNIEKYKTTYNKVLQKTKRCDTLVFGEVDGDEKVFLISYMCPVTKDYIENIYQKDNAPVKIDSKLQKEVCTKAAKVLGISKYNVKIIFPDVFAIEEALLSGLSAGDRDPPKPKPLALRPHEKDIPERGS